MVISKQITFNVEQAVGTLATGGDTHLTYRSMGSVLSTDSTRRDSVGNRGRLSRTEMSYLANRRGSNGTEMERIRHIQALQKAKRDLVVVSSFLLACFGAPDRSTDIFHSNPRRSPSSCSSPCPSSSASLSSSSTSPQPTVPPQPLGPCTKPVSSVLVTVTPSA